jgi:hypothetical protein
MRKLWKNFRINFMYWRFRNITRNRLRLQAWYHRKQPVRTYRGRGTAAYVYRGSSQRTWIAVLVMVCILTALRVLGNHYSTSPTLILLVSLLVVIGTLYWTVRGI